MPKCVLNLPDFIIVGANKAGTTSLANYLNQHPEIKISDVKEPMFFSTDPYQVSSGRSVADLARPFFSNSLCEYSRLYDSHEAGVVFFGEASTSYLACSSVSAPLIKKLVPNVRIIAVLREPVSRAVSAYKMCYGNKIEGRDFAQVVSDSLDHHNVLRNQGVREYVRNGLYGKLILPYLELFERENIIFVRYEDFCSNPVDVLERLTAHIGASDFSYCFNKKYNTESEHVDGSVLILDEDRRRLKNHFAEDIKITQDLTGLDLSGWL